MSLKKVFAVGIAVFGIVGMASAQSPSPVYSESPLAPGPTTGQMDVSYEVRLTAEMTVTSKGLSGNGLFVDPSVNTLPGNMGSIVVKTNYPFWDITASAANGLRLKQTDGNNVVVEPPFGGGAPVTPPGPTLLAEDAINFIGTSDTALLTVYVGIVNGNAFAFAPVDFTDSLKAGVVSFADIIGTELDSDEYNGQEGKNTTGDGIADVGFVTPSSADGVTFYVNAGLGPNAKITKTKNGVYKETLVFTLLAGF